MRPAWRDSDLQRILELLVEDVDDAARIRADRAAGLAEVPRRHVVGGRDLRLAPRVAAVPRGRDDERSCAAADEVLPADVDVPEERARRGVVRPDLLLVGERGRALLAYAHGLQPRRLVAG